MPSKPIPVPKLLDDSAARELNNKMLENNKTFVFLTESNRYLDGNPSTFREAFKEYVSDLYVLYHDCGMEFLKCYLSLDVKLNGTPPFYFSHMTFAKNSRSGFQHSPNPDIPIKIFAAVEKIFYRKHLPFDFEDWNDFREKAEESDWEVLVRQLVAECNSIYDLLDRIASCKPGCITLSRELQNIFISNGSYSYSDKSGTKSVDIYSSSFDHRLRDLIHRHIKTDGKYQWQNNAQRDKAEQIMGAFVEMKDKPKLLTAPDRREPKKILEDLITAIKNYLKDTTFTDDEDQSYPNSVKLLDYIIQATHTLIAEEADKELYSDDDFLN